ncbi:unnamed protein product, partial [Larinioides sclopetarius]
MCTWGIPETSNGEMIMTPMVLKFALAFNQLQLLSSHLFPAN